MSGQGFSVPCYLTLVTNELTGFLQKHQQLACAPGTPTPTTLLNLTSDPPASLFLLSIQTPILLH